jgi:hypothetical protein
MVAHGAGFINAIGVEHFLHIAVIGWEFAVVTNRKIISNNMST